MQNLPESKYLGQELGPPELRAIFQGGGDGAVTIGTLNSGPEPEPGTECFPGAGAGVVRNFFGLGVGERGL